MPILFVTLPQATPTVTISVAAPPASPAPPPAPIVRSSPQGMVSASSAGQRYVIDVDVRAAGVPLWSGALRVASGHNTSVSRTQSEPAPVGCEETGLRPEGTSFSFALMPLPGALAAEGRIRVSVRWSRPMDEVCGAEGTRTIELNQTVLLAPGATLTIKGDAGLTVRLRRR